jgi:hypothetical protein
MEVTLANRFSIVNYLREKYYVVIFAIFLVLMALVVPRHEPWMDEAQAWLLAKDVSFKDLIIKYLRYEGSPGLWHVVLMIPAKLGFPYFTINIISAVFAATGVWLFLRYAPFPILIKVLYPFTFFVFFQYGVVARSYCLISPILFLLAMNYDKKMERPYLFVFLLCLLANISAHTFLIAGSIAFIHFIDVLKAWKVLPNKSKITHAIALFIFGIIGCIVIYIIMTPPDQIYASRANWDFINFCRSTQWMIGGSLIMSEFKQLSIYPITSVIVFLITMHWLGKNNLLIVYVLPLLLLCTLFAIKYRNYWHQGVLFLLWIFVLWISFEKYRNIVSRPLSAKAVIGCLGVVLAVQFFWCIKSVAYDLSNNYSGSYTLARYIKRHNLDKEKIYVSGWRNISVLPYFSKNIFYNHNNGSNHRFWNWSVNNVTSVGATEKIIDTIECEQPDVVIFASDHIPSRYRIDLPGYKSVAFFKGYMCWKTGLLEPECYLVFRKEEEELEKIVYEDKGAINKNKSLQ